MIPRVSAPALADGSVVRDELSRQPSSSERKVLTKVDGYIDAYVAAYRHAIDAFQPLPASLLDAVETGVMKDIYRRLADRGSPSLSTIVKGAAPNRRCVYCEITVGSELDHYAPMGTYGELGLEAVNLVAACGTCNRHKLALDVGKLVDRLPHAYLEPSQPPKYLFADISPSPVGPLQATFRVEWPAATSTRVIQVHNRLLSRLQLLTRYSYEGTLELGEHQEIRGRSRRALQRWAVAKAAHLATHHHHNYWKAALFEAVGRFARDS